MINVYSEAQLREQGLIYFRGDSFATNVWISKYAMRDKDGNYLEANPDHTIQRIAKEIKRIEDKFPNSLTYEEIYSALEDFKYFIFGGSILYGAGNPYSFSSLGNCFFIDNGADSYGGIFNMEETMIQLMKRRGGVGITLEHLRPESSPVSNAARSSTGAVSFAHRFSNGTREVAQDGRRGALMISMDLNHPNSEKFITLKDDLTKVTGANISVKVSDEFMRAVESDSDYYLTWPVQEKQPEINETFQYDKLYILDSGLHIKRVKAKKLWNQLITQAHKNAEPGIMFWDKMTKDGPQDFYPEHGFTTKGTNPCGELGLSDKDSCRLGSLNLKSFVEKPFETGAHINWKKLEKYARIAQRFMDDIAELEEEKIDRIIEKIKLDKESEFTKRVELETWIGIKATLKRGRRTGLGFLGLGDAIAGLGLKFGEKGSNELTEKIVKTIAINSYKESVNLAKERGAFPVWSSNNDSNSPFIRRVISDNFSKEEYSDYLRYGRRNIANLAIAPTGSLAILAQTTSGIEPVFKIFYRRRRKVNPGEENVKISFVDQNGDSWEEYNIIHFPFVEWFIKNSDSRFEFKGAYNFLKDLPEEDLKELIKTSPWGGSESHEIDYIERVNLQGLVQKWIDHSISSTINLPEKISVDKVNEIYFHGWRAGVKGLTIYREGSRTGVLLSSDEESKKSEFSEHNAPKRPKVLPADYYYAKAKGKEFAVIIGKWPDTDRPYEVFAFENPPMAKNTKGKTIKVKKGQYKFVNGEFEIEDLHLAAENIEERALTLTASMLLRHGAPIKHVINVIHKIDDNITSFSSAVRRYLSRYAPQEEILGEACPNCGEALVNEGGCVQCKNPECGFSKCG